MHRSRSSINVPTSSSSSSLTTSSHAAVLNKDTAAEHAPDLDYSPRVPNGSSSSSISYPSSAKDLNVWRKLSKGYALRVMLALQSGRLVPIILALITLLLLSATASFAWMRLWGVRTTMHGQQAHFAVYIDGGSSGTRVHVFRYQLAPWPEYVALELPDRSAHVEPGLSHFADQPQAAADSLVPLLQFAYSQVPEHQWHATPVRLLATAGLRLVTEQQRESILTTCRSLLASSPFAFRHDWAKVIGGEMEGVYAWTGANYAAGMLQAVNEQHQHQARRSLQPAATGYHGVMELGGASFQITFLPAASHDMENGGVSIRLPGIRAHLFTHSFLGLGMDAALLKAAEVVLQRGSGAELDPCLPVGYTAPDGRQGGSSFTDCLVVALQVGRTGHWGDHLAMGHGVLFALKGPLTLNTWYFLQQVLPIDGCAASNALNHDRSKESEESHATAQQGISSSSEEGGAGHHAQANPGSDPTHDSGSSRSSKSNGGAVGGQELDIEGGGAVSRSGSLRGGRSGSRSISGRGSGSGNVRGRCRVDGIETPVLSGTFLAVENLFWTAKALGLHVEATLQELHDAGHRHCSHHWTSLHAQFSGHVPDQFLTRYCFGAAYVFTLLHVGLGVGLNERVLRFTNTLLVPPADATAVETSKAGEEEAGGNEVTLNWINGAFVMDAMGEERDSSTQGFLGLAGIPVPEHSGVLRHLLLPASLLSLVVFGAIWWQRRRRGLAGASRAHDVSAADRQYPYPMVDAGGTLPPASASAIKVSKAGLVLDGVTRSRQQQQQTGSASDPGGDSRARNSADSSRAGNAAIAPNSPGRTSRLSRMATGAQQDGLARSILRPASLHSINVQD